jgi:hypothetical protein
VTTELLTSDILDTDEFWSNEIMKVNTEFLFGCSTGLLDGGYGDRNGISEGHAYVIMEARELSTGERLVKLRNPWGKIKQGNWEGPWSDGSKEFTPDAQRELNHKFGSDSVFWISFGDLLRKYQHFDRTRLFMDSPDWRISQKWISVEVPWLAEFEERFRIVLTKESPVVLVLSQLDDRYFEGLKGQYSFRLQFRLHEIDSPGEEDYIVRSHGNYLMDRSVVTELKSLGPGTYSVFIQVVGDRDSNASSVEDVIKSECRRKIDNDKLAQVGAMYDLAHSKGAIHLKSRAAARSAQDKAKAREARIATRKKNWERRHLSREIIRKQTEKNRQKRERKDAQDIAEAKEKKERAPKDQAIQTEDIKIVQIAKEDKGVQTEDHLKDGQDPAPEPEPMKDTDKAVQTDFISASSSSSNSTPGTPSSSSTVNSPIRIHIPYNGPPPVYPRHRAKDSSSRHYNGRPGPGPGPPPPPNKQYYISDGDSSASPISDYDDMYSDDDPTLKPRLINTEGTPKPDTTRRSNESEDENEPEPWNAVCIVGLRVYSKDENLEVRIVDDGCEEAIKDDEGTDGDVEDFDDTKTNANDQATTANAETTVEFASLEGIGDAQEKSIADAVDGTGRMEVHRKKDSKSDEEPALPIRAKETEELVLIDNEKKALGLGSESSTVSANGGASLVQTAAGEKEVEMKAESSA